MEDLIININKLQGEIIVLQKEKTSYTGREAGRWNTKTETVFYNDFTKEWTNNKNSALIGCMLNRINDILNENVTD